MRKAKNTGKSKYRILYYVLLCAGYFWMMYGFAHQGWFDPDELDIFAGGKAIAHGYQLYSEYFSQHMPFTYYFSALFELLGAHSIILQRCCFYLFIAVLLTVVNIVYRNGEDPRVLFFTPIIVYAIEIGMPVGTAILSEQVAWIGFWVLFLEYKRYLRRSSIRIDTCIMVSIAVVLTFGTIFVGIFAIAVIALAVIVHEVRLIAEHEKKIIACISQVLSLALIIAIPWILLLIYYKAIHSLYDFYYWAYLVNREIYPKYYGGFGSSVFSAVISLPLAIASTVADCFIATNFSINNVCWIIILLGIIAYIIREYKKNGKVRAIVITFYTLALSTRGTFTFHGIPWIGFCSYMAVSTLTDIWDGINLNISDHQEHKKTLLQAICIFLVLILLSQYLTITSELANFDLQDPDNWDGDIINVLTEPDEPVWNLTLMNTSCVSADRPTIYNIACVPWFYDAAGKRIRKKLRDNPPRIAYFNPDQEVWGYKLSDYAPDMKKYMLKYYKPYDGDAGSNLIYIRKDYYDEAMEILSK